MTMTLNGDALFDELIGRGFSRDEIFEWAKKIFTDALSSEPEYEQAIRAAEQAAYKRGLERAAEIAREAGKSLGDPFDEATADFVADSIEREATK